MIKKTILALSISAGMLLMASPALAMAYAPATFGAGMPTSTSGGMMQTGTISYRGMPMQPGMNMAYGYGNAAAWYGLMFVITVALVWVVLLLLILLLLKMLKKHK